MPMRRALLFVPAAIAALAALVSTLVSAPVAAAESGVITGIVVDSVSGLPVSGVAVETIGKTHTTVHTDSAGRFSIESLESGSYQIKLVFAGYQTTLSDSVGVGLGAPTTVTLSMQQQNLGSETIRTLGRTTVRASESLQHSAVVVKQQSVESIERAGIFRLGDALRTLPQINPNASTGGGDTPSPGDDLYFDIRGIGGLETIALMDGHPLGYGLNRGKQLGYNFEVSPTFALRAVQVTYGSGVAGLTPYSSVGGTIDMLTLEPTPVNEASFTQGFGTYGKLVTSFNATGKSGTRLGYAFALGTQGIDGPYKNAYFFQPSAAFDPSAPPGTLAHDSGIYKDDTAVVNRGDFLKLRYALSDAPQPAHLTLSAIDAYYWDDKTGNGDADFLPYDTALALGNASLASYSGSCPSGTFAPTNANGAPWGTGPNGQPDGGLSCVTPQQYASIAGGLQGAGPAYQTFTMDDYHLKYDRPLGRSTIAFDVYTNRFFQIYDRTAQLPFIAQPGDNAFWLSPSVNTTGGSLTDQFTGLNNDIGFGYATNNYAYLFKQNGTVLPSPVVHDGTLYMQDVLHPASSKYQLYFNAAETGSTITHKSAFDPRLALVKQLSDRDVLRLATGATTIQPYATYLDLPYSPVAVGALNGVLNCTGLTPIGQVSNPNIRPENANDQELSYGHSFQSGSQFQLTLYNENVNDKIYATIIPVSTLPPGVIDPATLNQFETAINAACGTTGLSGVGVTSQANVGRLLARGIDFTGRLRTSPKLFFDYDYSVESSALKSADTTTLQNNLILLVGSQLPGVPLQKSSLAADVTIGRNIDARLEQYWIAANNSKNSGAYNYGNLTVNIPVHNRDSVAIAVNNVFNQYTHFNGLIGEGYPLPLNQYATPGQYAPLIGAGATELFGLPSRQLFVSYTFHMQ